MNFFSSHIKPKVNKDRCNHVWISTNLTKATPTYCDECHSLCFIFQDLRKCSFCESYLHQGCFQKRVDESCSSVSGKTVDEAVVKVSGGDFNLSNNTNNNDDETSAVGSSMNEQSSSSSPSTHFHAKDGQVIQQQEHVHSLILAKSATIGSYCDVCQKHIFSFGGGSHHYFYCVDCDFRAHRECYEETFVRSHTLLKNIKRGQEQDQKVAVSVSKQTGEVARADPHDFSAENQKNNSSEDENQNNNNNNSALSSSWERIDASSLPKVSSLPIMTEEEYLKTVEEKSKKLADSKNTVISGTFDIVKALDQRNRKWGEYVLNPVSLYRVQKRQAAVYLELVNELAEQARTKDKSIIVARDLLDQLHDLLRYSTAMYGRAYFEGYFASVARNLILQTFKKDLVNAKPEQNNEAVANILGISRSKILLSFWGEEISEPTFAVIDDVEQNNRVILAFRGSITESDFATDACGTLMDFDISSSCSGQQQQQPMSTAGVKVHAGIASSANKLFDKNHKLYIIDKLIEIMKKFPLGTKLQCIGHSLGGGLVQVFCLRALASECLNYEHPSAPGHIRRTKQFLFGYAFAPPPIFTKPFADKFDNNIISVVAAKDCVPRLQLPAVDRLGAHFLATKRIKPETGDEEELTLAECLEEDKEIAQALETQEECHLAGKIVFTTHPTNRMTKAYFIPRESPLLHTVFVSSHMINNHVMDNYSEALQLANVVDEDKIRHEIMIEFGDNMAHKPAKMK